MTTTTEPDTNTDLVHWGCMCSPFTALCGAPDNDWRYLRNAPADDAPVCQDCDRINDTTGCLECRDMNPVLRFALYAWTWVLSLAARAVAKVANVTGAIWGAVTRTRGANMTTPTTQPVTPDARHATRAHAARSIATVVGFLLALIGAAGAISVADSGDWRADGLAVVVAAGAIVLAASLYRDLHQQARTR